MRLLTELALLGGRLDAVRAWPAADGSLTVEGRDAEGRLRAGRLTGAGLELTEFGSDRKLPGLAVRDGDRLLVHRLNKRAVLRRNDHYVKVLRKGRAEGVLAASLALAAPCAAAGIATADVVASDGDTITFAPLAGRTLHDLADDGLDGWSALADAWPALAAARVGLPAHDAAREAETLLTWVGHAEAFAAFPAHAPALRAAAERVARDLVDGRADREALVHRDLHDKQALWEAGSGTLGLLDLDTAARGEAALDLANLGVHLDLRVRQGVLASGTARQVRAVLAPVADAVGATAERLALYARSTRLRLACVYAFRPDAGPWLGGWLDDALSA